MISRCRKCGGKGKIHVYRYFSTMGSYIQCEKCSASTFPVFNSYVGDSKKEAEEIWNRGFIR